MQNQSGPECTSYDYSCLLYTSLLTREQWDEEITFKRMYDQPYIFAYFLGKSEENREQAKKRAELTGLKIVTVHHMDTYNKADVGFGDYAPFEVGPEEFLNLYGSVNLPSIQYSYFVQFT